MTEIYAIEVTSRCNMACDWCPHRKMTRVKSDMSWIDYQRSIQLCIYLKQKSIILNNIGEPLLNPHIFSMVALATSNYIETVFSTNGERLTTNDAIELKIAGLNKIKNLTWADQHEHELGEQINTNTVGCKDFIHDKRVVIFSDGSIGTCCIDYENIGKLGSIWDDNWFELEPKPLPFCKECHNE